MNYFWHNHAIKQKGIPQNAGLCLLFFILFTTGLVSTFNGAIIHSKTTGGNWNAVATWVGGVIPAAGDDVVIDAVTATPVNVNVATAILASVSISDGALLTMNQTLSCTHLIVGGGISGALFFPSTTARTLTASGNLTIATGGSVFVSGSNAVSNVLSVAGNFTNSGSFDGTGSGTNRLNVTFANGGTSTAFDNTGAAFTRFNVMTLVKGAGNTLDFNPTTAVAFPATGFLAITSGIFKLNGFLALSNPVFSTAVYTIPAAGGFWLNNPNAIVTGQNGAATLAGTLRISTGIFTIGTTNSSMGFSAGAKLTMEGGILSSVARFGVAAAGSAISYNQSAGTVYVNTLGGNASTTLASFDMGTSASTTFTMSGGNIIVVNGSANTEYRGPATGATSSITGGTLQLGTAAVMTTPTIAVTPMSTNFKITAVTPNLVLNATNNPSVAASGAVVIKGDLTLNGTGAYTSNNLGLTLSGNSVTNPGNITIAGANLTLTGTTILTFNGTFGNQSLNTTGTITSGSIPNMVVNNTSASDTIILNTPLSVNVGLTLTNGIVKTTAVNLLKLGTLSAAGTLTGGSALSYMDGPIARTFATTSVTMNNTTLFPVGKNGLYLPVNLGPTITGVVQLQAEVFTTNAGSNISPSGTISQHRWEASVITNPVNLTGILLKEADATIGTTNSILKSAAAGGVYRAITPASTYAAGPPATLLSATALSATEFINSGYFSFGDACNAVLSLTGPLSICVNSVSRFVANSALSGWSSSATGVATIDPSGNVTGVSTGSTVITFTSSVGFCAGLTTDRIVTVMTCSATPGGAGNNLISWYKSDAGLTPVSWEDAMGPNLLTASGSPSVTGSSLNFNPVATVGGTSDYYSNANAEGWLGTTNATTYYYVAKLTASTISRAVYGRGSGSSAVISAHGGNRGGRVFASGAVNALPQTGSWTTPSVNLSRGGFNGGTPGLYYVNSNGGAEVTGTSSTPTIAGNGPFYLGRSVTAGNNWGGDIAELIAYNEKHSSMDYNRVESYLALKYGITLSNSAGGSAGNYLLSDGNVVWTASVTSNYHTKVIGIVRDDASGLTQKQSRTMDDTTRIYLSTLSADNNSNAGSFSSDLQSVVIGSDVKVLRSNGSLEYPTGLGIYRRIEREWKISNYNFNGSFSLDITLNTSPVTVADLRILIDDDGNFTNAVLYNPSISYAGGVVTVSGLSTTHIPVNTTKYLTIVSLNNTTPLPIDLVEFNATAMDNAWVKLDWKTETELNNRYFTIEKSADGITWDDVVREEGAGTSTALRTYRAFDYSPYEGISYYRLRQTDFNSQYRHSPIKTVTIDKLTKGVRMYPNPFSNVITIEGPASETNALKVYTVTGKEVTDLTKIAALDTGRVVFDGSKLSSGIYLLRTSTMCYKICKE